MITVTLSQEEIRERGQELAQCANRLIELQEEEDDLKASYKTKMADVKERRLEISSQMRRLSRAVRLGVEERSEQRVLFDEEQRMEEFRQQQASKEAVTEFFDPNNKAHLGERHKHIVISPEAEGRADEERTPFDMCACGHWQTEHYNLSGACAHGDGDCNCGAFRSTEPEAQAGTDDEGASDYQDEWRAGLSAEEREKHDSAPCRCGHPRNFHDGDDSTGECTALNCGPTYPIPRCQGYHCPDCDAKGCHRANCDHYVLGEGTPARKEEEEVESDPDEVHTPQLFVPKLEDALEHALLHHVQNAAKRWNPLQRNGATDAELLARVADEFAGEGGSTANGGWRVKGGKSPQFTWNYDGSILKGKRLLANVRKVLQIGPPVQTDQTDDFTAERCDQCKMIEGGHAPKCSKSDALHFADYLAYAKAHYKSNHQSHARKMELSKLKDEEIRAWKQQAGTSAEPEPEKKPKRSKLSPVEAAIDR